MTEGREGGVTSLQSHSESVAQYLQACHIFIPTTEKTTWLPLGVLWGFTAERCRL